METLGISSHKVVYPIPNYQALENKLDVCKLAFIDSPFDSIDVKLTILRNVKFSVNGANI